MGPEKLEKTHMILDLMRVNEITIKDLSIVIANYSGESIAKTQREIKGFLYSDPKIAEP